MYNLLLLPAALVLFTWSKTANEFESYLWDTAKCQPTQNTFKHKLRIQYITLYDITYRLLRIVSTDFLALRLICFNIRQHGRQILYFKLHVDGRKFHYRRPHAAARPQVVHRWIKENSSAHSGCIHSYSICVVALCLQIEVVAKENYWGLIQLHRRTKATRCHRSWLPVTASASANDD